MSLTCHHVQPKTLYQIAVAIAFASRGTHHFLKRSGVQKAEPGDKQFYMIKSKLYRNKRPDWNRSQFFSALLVCLARYRKAVHAEQAWQEMTTAFFKQDFRVFYSRDFHYFLFVSGVTSGDNWTTFVYNYQLKLRILRFQMSVRAFESNAEAFLLSRSSNILLQNNQDKACE